MHRSVVVSYSWPSPTILVIGPDYGIRALIDCFYVPGTYIGGLLLDGIGRGRTMMVDGIPRPRPVMVMGIETNAPSELTHVKKHLTRTTESEGAHRRHPRASVV